MVTDTLKRTPLYNWQKDLGARFVDFHGWDLPIQFSSILKEHRAVRSSCGLFDVSHMGQIFVSGPQALEFLQKIHSNDASKLEVGRAMYSHMLNVRGGVVDDVIFSRLEEDRWLVVVNAGTIGKDVAWMEKHAEGFDVRIDDRSEEMAMLALQGPKAEKIIATVVPDAVSLKRFGALSQKVYGQSIVVTRTGYTGEDGFEIVAPGEIAIRIWRTLDVNGRSDGLLPCGLGARDTLRLEAGYLLYGSDIDDDHTPLEAQYGWVVKFDKGDFIGKAALEAQRKEGLRRKLYAVRLTGGGVPRPGAKVLIEGRSVGTLASATFSPTLSTGIGVGYLDGSHWAAGTKVDIDIRGRSVRGEIVSAPFYRPEKKT